MRELRSQGKWSPWTLGSVWSLDRDNGDLLTGNRATLGMNHRTFA